MNILVPLPPAFSLGLTINNQFLFARSKPEVRVHEIEQKLCSLIFLFRKRVLTEKTHYHTSDTMRCINTAFFALIYLSPLCVSISTLPESHSYKRSEQVSDNNSFDHRALLSGEQFRSEHQYNSFESQLTCLGVAMGHYEYIVGGELSSSDDYESTPGSIPQKTALRSSDLILPHHCHIVGIAARILDKRLSDSPQDH